MESPAPSVPEAGREPGVVGGEGVGTVGCCEARDVVGVAAILCVGAGETPDGVASLPTGDEDGAADANADIDTDADADTDATTGATAAVAEAVALPMALVDAVALGDGDGRFD